MHRDKKVYFELNKNPKASCFVSAGFKKLELTNFLDNELIKMITMEQKLTTSNFFNLNFCLKRQLINYFSYKCA